MSNILKRIAYNVKRYICFFQLWNVIYKIECRDYVHVERSQLLWLFPMHVLHERPLYVLGCFNEIDERRNDNGKT